MPVPWVESIEALNDDLAGQCRWRQAARLRGHGEAIGERLARDREALLPLPPAPYDACDKRPGRVRSLSLVRYRDNDYSVPVAYGYREVVIRGYVDQVVIGCGAEGIARHRRSYERMSPGLKAWLDSRNAADVPQELLDDLAREMRKAIPEIEREMRANAVRAARIRAEGRPLF